MQQDVQNLKNGARRGVSRLNGAGLSLAVNLAAAALLFVAVAGAFVFGFEVGHREFFPYRVLEKADHKIATMIEPRQPKPQVSETGLIELRQEVVLAGSSLNWQNRKGGALASFGEDVLFLNYDGDIIAARSADTVRETAVKAPENNRTDFQRDYRKILNDPEYAGVAPRGVNYLRYNDILYFESADWRGFIASYTEYNSERQCYANALARLDIDRSIDNIDELRADPEDWYVFFRTSPCLSFKTKRLAMAGQMAGGRLAIRDGRSVYLSSGDFGFDGMRSDGVALAQEPEAQYGKVLHVDIFTGAAEIVSSGHRNIQGLAVASDGGVYATEHAPRGGDEINHIREGLNYGWPYETYGTLYSKQKLPRAAALGRHEKFTPPLYSWIPSPAISGLTIVDGFHPAWDGDFLASSLKHASIYRLRRAEGRIVYSERIHLGARLRDIHQHTDGRIAALTEDYRIIFLTGEDLANDEEQINGYIVQANLHSREAARLRAAAQSCAECHSFGPVDDAAAPGLAWIYGDKIAAGAFNGYSPVLKAKNGRWTEENLSAFLSDTQGFAPGALMPDPGLDDPETIENLVDYLKFLDNQR